MSSLPPEQLIELDQETVAKLVKVRKTLEGFGGPLRRDLPNDLGAANVQLLMNSDGFTKKGNAMGIGEILKRDPCAQPTLSRVEGRRYATGAVQERLDRTNP